MTSKPSLNDAPEGAEATPATPEPGQRPDAAPSLRYPCGEPPGTGDAREVAPGVWWLRLPLPFSLNHINAWALADADEHGPGWAIVDTGTKTPEVVAAWSRLLATDGPLARADERAITSGADGARAPRVTRVIVTHMHPDHVGMSGWLTRKYDCRLWMTRLEYLTCRTLAADTGREAPDDGVRFYRRCGWSEEALDLYRARFGGFGKYLHPLPDSFQRLADGQRVRIGAHEWRVIVGRGHSPEHACLVSDDLGVLISGDQVLPRISSNVSVFPTEPEADPLGDWIDSLGHLRATLGDHLLVLPAHGDPFQGLHARLDRLLSGHARGLERLRRSLGEPRRAIDLFGALFARPIEAMGDQLGMATGESMAHLNHLMALGEVRREADADGVYRYRMI